MSMKKYIKKPVEIEAVQWNGFNPTEVKEFAEDNVEIEYYDAAYEAGAGPVVATVTIHTLEGDMKANKGDYIIKGVKGEFYPCRKEKAEENLLEDSYGPGHSTKYEVAEIELDAYITKPEYRRKCN